MLLQLLLFCSLPWMAQAQNISTTTTQPLLEYDFDNLPRCNLTTQELFGLSPSDPVAPCLLFDIAPHRQHYIPHRTTLVTLVQVTPATACRDARDGATTSVERLNAQDDHRGLALGFHHDYHVQFRLVSLVAGNADQLGADAYGRQHDQVLRAALQATQAQYIVGTCSFASAYDKPPARDYQTMVLAQVGPPGYYQDDSPPNPYVFGVHINSDEYPLPTVRALGFRAAAAASVSEHALADQPVRVLYRTQSEFFQSTCESALRALDEFGFQNVEAVAYDPDGDDNDNGIVNQFDTDWLRQQADSMCPPSQQSSHNNATTTSSSSSSSSTPALFACVLTEQDVLLQRWKENGCRPTSLWMTPATWGWAALHEQEIAYVQGGGQWHPSMSYGDRFFDSGTALLEYKQNKFGYPGSYDTVVRIRFLGVCLSVERRVFVLFRVSLFRRRNDTAALCMLWLTFYIVTLPIPFDPIYLSTYIFIHHAIY